LREDFGNAGWVKWMEANVPEISLHKATRLASIGPKYRDGIPGQLEFKTVKELYQATDILPPPAETSPKSKVVDMNWPKLTEKIEAMIPNLNDGQKELLRAKLKRIVEEML
jgi:hypothetical protein